MKRRSSAVLMTVIVLAAMRVGDARAQSTTAETDAPTFSGFLQVADPSSQRQYLLRLQSRFDAINVTPNNPLEQDLLTVLSNPVHGYRDGRIIASVLGALNYERGRNPFACPVKDESVALHVQIPAIQGIGAIRYCPNRSGFAELRYPDQLFVYWRNTVFVLPSKAFLGGNPVYPDHAVIRNVREVSEREAETETRLELWLLDTVQAQMGKILDLTLSKGIIQAGEYMKYYGADWTALGGSLSDIEAYYREDVASDQVRPRCHSAGPDVVSPYFLCKRYVYDKAKAHYLETQSRKIEHSDFLVQLSRMSTEEGLIASYYGTEGVLSILKDFMLYDSDPVSAIVEAFPLLRPIIQQALLEELQKSVATEWNMLGSLNELKKRQETLRTSWKRYLSEDLCRPQ